MLKSRDLKSANQSCDSIAMPPAPCPFLLHDLSASETETGVIHCVDARTSREMALHVLPSAAVLGPERQQRLETAWKRCRGAHKPFTEISGRWLAGDRQVFAEELPQNSLRLQEILDDRDELPGELALSVGRQVHRALKRATRQGMAISSLHPTDVFLEKTQLSGENRAPGGIRLRALPGILDPAPKHGFAELIARILGDLPESAHRIARNLRESGAERGCDAEIRSQLLQSLSHAFKNRVQSSAEAKIVEMPQEPAVRARLIAGASR